MVVVREEDIGEVDLAAWDINRLEGVDEGLVEALDVVVFGRVSDGGEGRLGLRKDSFCILWGGHGADDEKGAQGLAQQSSWVKHLKLVKSI